MSIEPIRSSSSCDDAARLDTFLESLQSLCMEAGAHRCAVIQSGDLPFTDPSEGMRDVPLEEKSIFWPVPRFPRDSIEDALRLYRVAVVFGLNIDDGATSRAAAMRKTYDIAGRVESACFYGGYHLAIGLAAGNCKEVFCGEERKCQALTVGKPCKYPLRSRPSIEACGLDPEAVAAKAGWEDIQPGTFLVGMVFVV